MWAQQIHTFSKRPSTIASCPTFALALRLSTVQYFDLFKFLEGTHEYLATKSNINPKKPNIQIEFKW